MTNVIRNRFATSIGLGLFLSLVGTAPVALGDVGEIDVTTPYTPLNTLGTSVKGVDGVWHGLGDVKLQGWTFPFAKTSFNEFMVSADGFMTVGNGQKVCGCTASVGNDLSCPNSQGSQTGCSGNNPPYGSYYNEICCYTETIEFEPWFSPGLIAPMYLGEQQTNGAFLGSVTALQGGVTGAHYLIVDWNGVGSSEVEYNYSTYCDYGCACPSPPYYAGDTEYCYTGVYNLTFPKHFEAIIFESGAIAFTYGTDPSYEVTESGSTYYDYTESIVGTYFPPPDGGMGITDAGTMLGPSNLYSSGCMGNWEGNEETFCSFEQNFWPSLSSAYMGEVNAPFLVSAPSPAAAISPSGPQLSIGLGITNEGMKNQAGGFPVDFFLVPQGVAPFTLPSTCAGQSTCLGGPLTFTGKIPSSGGTASQVFAGIALPHPLPKSGIYAVASVLDPANTTLNAEAPLLEIGVSNQLLYFGQDMTGKIDVTNFMAVQPGEFSVPIEFTNLGLEDAITVPYTVSFIAQDGTPTQVATGTLNGISALTTQLVNQDITIPQGLPNGIYVIQVQIALGVPTDLNPNNNTFVGVQNVENGQDLTASIISVPFSIPTPTTFPVPVTFHNLGLQAATAIPYTLSLTSADGTATYQVGGGVETLAGLSVDTKALTATIKQTLPSGNYNLSLQIQSNSAGGSFANADLNLANNLVMGGSPVYVYSQTVDFAVGPGDLVLDGSAHAADGQVIGVTRTIHNLQGNAPPCPYSYFLNPPTVFLKGNGVPVSILSPTGPTYVGTTPPFEPYGTAGANNTATDQIVIPDGMPPGTYNLVLVLDPDDTIDDINPSNNDVAVSLNLAANPLQITSPSSLFAAILDTPYFYQLEESGGAPAVSWSLLAGSLPPGITLDAAGQISGTPTTAGVFTFVVQLASGGGTQVAVLQLPVAAGSGALSIEQGGTQLPSAIVMSPYIQQLVAQGGVPPYSWKGSIPPQFSMLLSTGGVLAGTPLEASGGPVQFTVIVTDSIGTQASATLTLQVISPSALTITTPFLQPAVVGENYSQAILASDGTITGATFNWSLPTGTTLPSGINFQEIGNPAVADLSGEPTQAGIFPIVINLADNFGHSVTRQYILTVTEAPVMVGKQSLPVAIIGQSFAGQLQASSKSTLTWRIFSGALPPGLSLAPTGAISGTVPAGTVTGVYPFSAAVTDANGEESVVAINIQVQNPPAASGGCATGSGPAGAGLLLLGLAWLARRRRRGFGAAGLAAAGALLLSAPIALAQVPLQPCGTPPMPIKGTIQYQDISTLPGYVPLAAPMAPAPNSNYNTYNTEMIAADAYSDTFGGVAGQCEYFYCYSQSNESDTYGPFGVPHEVATISLPFPFGFSGIYADGGAFGKPFQVNVWANGLLTFDPSVSFNPTASAYNTIPSDCQAEEAYIENENPCCTEFEVNWSLPVTGVVSDVFGGFPFTSKYSPPNGPVDALIAPWWGDLSVCPSLGSVGWLVTLDTSNEPMAIIQWNNVTATVPEKPNTCQGPGDISSCEGPGNSSDDLTLRKPGSTPQFSFQVRLHQNNDVDFVYGPSANFDPNNDCYDSAVGTCSYVSGLQSDFVFPSNERPPLANYSAQALDCSSVTGCLQSQFPSPNTSVTFKDVFRSVGPDLQVVGINPPMVIPQGATVAVPVEVSNGGGTASTGQGQVKFYFSAGGTTPEGGAFSVQNVVPYPACDTAPFNATVTLPASTPEGGGHLIAEFIPGAESVDQNHSFTSAPIIVTGPVPDLAAIGNLSFNPPAQVAGQDITISFTAQNVGEVPSPQSAYGVYLSLDGTVSSSGTQIYGAVIPPLTPGETYPVANVPVQLPLTLVSGQYFIGAIVDPSNTFKEANLGNNLAIGKTRLDVTSPGPVIETTTLQDAQVSSPYSVQLVAGGGDGKYQWSLAAGTLPGGLALSKGGLITGQAEAVGSSTFTVKVTDGVGHSATGVLSIGVQPFQAVLSIETVTLPAGSTGQLYNFTIAAVGGVAPYQWALVPSSGSLPAGISLVSNGTLTGEPQYEGTSTFQVTVTDSTGASVTSPIYTLTIFAAGTLAVGSTELKLATLNHTYNDVLHASGGEPSYTWQLLSVFREPAFPGDPGENLGTTGFNSGLQSIGLNFYAQGEVEGVPTSVGVFALTVEVTDSESPMQSAQGLVLLTITAATNFSFETVTLPPATYNEFYSTQLQTNAPANDMATFVPINSSQLATDTATECLPAGLKLYTNGQISGVPLETGTFSCLVEATDTQGGVAEQSFTIVVSALPAVKSGGCATGSGPAGAGLLLLGLAWLERRRRRSPRNARGER